MLASKMFDLRNYLKDQQIIFCYSGYMTDDILMGIGRAFKSKMELDQLDRQKTKTAFSVFVEQVQNVIRYSAEIETDEMENELRYGLLSIGQKADKIFISCGNIVKTDDALRLESQLQRIKEMDKDELKALWKETLRADSPDTSKGAGVGFIDIARRSKGDIEFDFAPINAGNVFFTLQAFL